MRKMKLVSAIGFALLIVAGCSSTGQVEEPKTVEQITGEVFTKLDREVAPVFFNCINFAASGTTPDQVGFSQLGYKKGSLLGALTYKKYADRKLAEINEQATTFAFIESGNICRFTSTEFSGMYLMAGWVRKHLVDQGWEKFKGPSQYQSLYKKDGITILMSGYQSSGQGQISLKKG